MASGEVRPGPPSHRLGGNQALASYPRRINTLSAEQRSTAPGSWSRTTPLGLIVDSGRISVIYDYEFRFWEPELARPAKGEAQ